MTFKMVKNIKLKYKENKLWKLFFINLDEHLLIYKDNKLVYNEKIDGSDDDDLFAYYFLDTLNLLKIPYYEISENKNTELKEILYKLYIIDGKEFSNDYSKIEKDILNYKNLIPEKVEKKLNELNKLFKNEEICKLAKILNIE